MIGTLLLFLIIYERSLVVISAPYPRLNLHLFLKLCPNLVSPWNELRLAQVLYLIVYIENVFTTAMLSHFC